MSNFTFELDDFTEEEFYSIVDYYRKFDKALSAYFVQEFDQSVQQLIIFPNDGNPYLHNTRRIILNRFPYAIVYKIYNEHLIVAHAVMHMKRKPDYWKEQL